MIKSVASSSAIPRAGICKPYLQEHQLLAPGTQLQFTRRGLDASLLADLYVILTGMTYTEIAKAARAGQPFNACVRHIGAYQPAPYHTAHVYECSVEFCKRMAALTPERIQEIAQWSFDWSPMRRMYMKGARFTGPLCERCRGQHLISSLEVVNGSHPLPSRSALSKPPLGRLKWHRVSPTKIQAAKLSLATYGILLQFDPGSLM